MIKNIIFDLGNVLFDLDYNLAIQAFERLGAQNFAKCFADFQDNGLIKLFEVNKITVVEFRRLFKESLKLEHITDVEFDAAWGALLARLPKANLALLAELRQRYQLYLYSNTNALHLPIIFSICERDTGYKNLSGFFTKEYYSHLFGYRKPDREGFNKILEENNLRPKETVFVDDHLPNIHGAEAVGLYGIHLAGDLNLFNVPKIINNNDLLSVKIKNLHKLTRE